MTKNHGFQVTDELLRAGSQCQFLIPHIHMYLMTKILFEVFDQNQTILIRLKVFLRKFYEFDKKNFPNIFRFFQKFDPS